MSTLRASVIRLASEKPELRQHLLPLLRISAKVYRFPEGTMDEKTWVSQYADRVEALYVPWESLMDRRKWNKLDGNQQKVYEGILKEKAKTPQYRAWKGKVFYEISQSTYMWATQHHFRA